MLVVIRSFLLASGCLAVLGVPSVAALECHGPVGKNETLWPIALRLRPDPSISPQRVMLSLLEANPEAFSRHNVNMLETGVNLCLGPEDLIGLDDDAAIAEVRRQNQEWKSRRMRVAAGSDDPVAVPPAPGGGGEADALRPGEIIAGFEPRLARIEGLIGELESRPGPEGVERALVLLEMRVARIEDQLRCARGAVRAGGPDGRARDDGADAYPGATDSRGDGTYAYSSAAEPGSDGADAHARAGES